MLVYVRPSNEALLRARVPGAQDQRGCLPILYRGGSASKKNGLPAPCILLRPRVPLARSFIPSFPLSEGDRTVVHEDLPGCPARKSGEEWQPVAKRRKEPSWFPKAPPGRAGLFTARIGRAQPYNRALLPSSLVISQGWGLNDLPLRASNEGLLRPRVARAQEIIRLHPSSSFVRFHVGPK